MISQETKDRIAKVMFAANTLATELNLNEKQEFYKYIKDLLYRQIHNISFDFVDEEYVKVVESTIITAASSIPYSMSDKKKLAKSLSGAPLYIPNWLLVIKESEIAFNSLVDTTREVLEIAEKFVSLFPESLHKFMFNKHCFTSIERKQKTVSKNRTADVLYYHLLQNDKAMSPEDKHKLRSVVNELHRLLANKTISNSGQQLQTLKNEYAVYTAGIPAIETKIGIATKNVERLAKEMQVVQSTIKKIEDLDKTDSLHVDNKPATKRLYDIRKARLDELHKEQAKEITSLNKYSEILREKRALVSNTLLKMKEPKRALQSEMDTFLHEFSEITGIHFKRKFIELLKQSQTTY